MTSKRPTRLDYCQYLLVSQTEDHLTSRLTWKIEQFHCEIKQLTGIEKNQANYLSHQTRTSG